MTSIDDAGNSLLLGVETDQGLIDCPACGVVEIGH